LISHFCWDFRVVRYWDLLDVRSCAEYELGKRLVV
jgi:hypothetical protein